jgi:hypothetical protein
MVPWLDDLNSHEWRTGIEHKQLKNHLLLGNKED